MRQCLYQLWIQDLRENGFCCRHTFTNQPKASIQTAVTRSLAQIPSASLARSAAFPPPTAGSSVSPRLTARSIKACCAEELMIRRPS
jgi:hypothetical protein